MKSVVELESNYFDVVAVYIMLIRSCYSRNGNC